MSEASKHRDESEPPSSGSRTLAPHRRHGEMEARTRERAATGRRTMRTLRNPAKTLDVHHRIALRDGGAPYDPDNLEALCRPCHRAELPGGRLLGPGAPTSPRWGFLSPIRRTAGSLPESPRMRSRVAGMDESGRATPLVPQLGWHRHLDGRGAASRCRAGTQGVSHGPYSRCLNCRTLPEHVRALRSRGHLPSSSSPWRESAPLRLLRRRLQTTHLLRRGIRG